MNEVAFVKKGLVTRWLGVSPNTQGLKALEARLIAAGNHKVRVPADTAEAQNLKRRRSGDEDLSQGGDIDSGQPIWALTRQASVFRVVAEERRRLLTQGEALLRESRAMVGGRLRVDTDKVTQARALFSQARALKVGAPQLAFFLSGQLTKVLTKLI